jgi:hypothetical protein
MSVLAGIRSGCHSGSCGQVALCIYTRHTILDILVQHIEAVVCILDKLCQAELGDPALMHGERTPRKTWRGTLHTFRSNTRSSQYDACQSGLRITICSHQEAHQRGLVLAPTLRQAHL